jgi:hypothetical protein
MSLSCALGVGSLMVRLDISGGGTWLAQTAAAAGVETYGNVSVVVRTAAASRNDQSASPTQRKVYGLFRATRTITSIELSKPAYC